MADDDPIDVAIVDNVDVSKSGLRSYEKTSVDLRVSQPSIIQDNYFLGRSSGIYVASICTHFEVDPADTTTADNGATCLVDAAGNRWKSVSGQGLTTIDFGAFPGSGDASVSITSLPGIAAGAKVTAAIFVADSADHTADEHAIDGPTIVAGNVVAGTGFTIYGRSDSDTDGVWNVSYQWQN